MKLSRSGLQGLVGAKREMHTHPSEYWTMRPFFDHANQQGPDSLCSDLLRMRITHGESPACEIFGTLHTRRSASDIWAASMSDFCLDEDPCQASPAMGDGALGVVRVCKMLKDGCSVAMRMEPFR